MTIHKHLASGRWFELSLMEQLANIGMDIERCIKWKEKGDLQKSQVAFERALDLPHQTEEEVTPTRDKPGTVYAGRPPLPELT